MKLFHLAACPAFMFLLVVVMPAATTPPDTRSAYEKAVADYIVAAGNEVQALRAQADEAVKGAPDATKQAYRGVYSLLEKCDAALVRLKAAKPEKFDAAKMDYEQVRTETVKELRRGRNP